MTLFEVCAGSVGFSRHFAEARIRGLRGRNGNQRQYEC
jgi:hypothetical protein